MPGKSRRKRAQQPTTGGAGNSGNPRGYADNFTLSGGTTPRQPGNGPVNAGRSPNRGNGHRA